MISPELLPIAGGLLLGCSAGYVWSRRRRWIHLLALAFTALCATVLSGEFRQSWAFLFADVGFVLAGGAIGVLVTRTALSRRRPGVR